MRNGNERTTGRSGWVRRGVMGMVMVALLLSAGVVRGDIGDYRSKLESDEWFKTDEGKAALDNIVEWQQPAGGWWKDYDPAKGRDGRTIGSGMATIDNHATFTELRLLARGIRIHDNAKWREAFEKGLTALLDAQYENGGWPQRFPDPKDYAVHITYNDNAMANVVRLLIDIAQGHEDFDVAVQGKLRDRAVEAKQKGIDCILKTQIKQDGKLTGWCQQHDKDTLEPTKGRPYELPSISGSETSDIIMVLMEIENPSDEVKRSIIAASQWMYQTRIEGKRLERFQNDGKSDVRLVDDPSAPYLWTRFRDLETGEPFFCGRDGEKKATLEEIERERRTGYSWYRPWGQKVLNAYPKWAAKHGVTETLE